MITKFKDFLNENQDEISEEELNIIELFNSGDVNNGLLAEQLAKSLGLLETFVYYWFKSVDHNESNIIDNSNWIKNTKKLKPKIKEITHISYQGTFAKIKTQKFIPENLDIFYNLKSLAMCEAKLTRVPKSIGELTNLTSLFLSDNLIEELPSNISNSKKLENLYVNDNLLTDVPKSLYTLTKLKSLGLEKNKLSDETKYKIRKTFPNIHVSL